MADYDAAIASRHYAEAQKHLDDLGDIDRRGTCSRLPWANVRPQ